MQELIIDATKSSPRIHFDPVRHVLEIRGESYPENATKFYTPVFAWLSEYLAGLGEEPVTVNVSISYFNSSSSKALMNLFDQFEEGCRSGRRITVNWYYDPENETALECGEEFKEDSCDLPFHLVARPEQP
ncbi:MAG: hypothetical protein BWK76_21470 [Desulfobulbaceae bacterium A2]|nr:MAG: hypothetical protein BWK76_21470 [Desulfobulbaceae bacterium A2]